jgi:hypothetical protein
MSNGGRKGGAGASAWQTNAGGSGRAPSKKASASSAKSNRSSSAKSASSRRAKRSEWLPDAVATKSGARSGAGQSSRNKAAAAESPARDISQARPKKRFGRVMEKRRLASELRRTQRDLDAANAKIEKLEAELAKKAPAEKSAAGSKKP